jgi:hypothetical protein
VTIPSLPNLHILPLGQLILHEDHDSQRTMPLVNRLRAAGLLRNPPIVMPLEDGSGRHVVLDGANRVTALQEMEFPHVVAQVADPHVQHVTLQTWNHVVWGLAAAELIETMRSAPGVSLEPIGAGESIPPPSASSAHLRLADGAAFSIRLPAELTEQVGVLNGIVNCYKNRASLDRTSQTRIDSFESIYPDLTGLVIFPRFDIGSVLSLAGKRSLLPTGITRFTVSPRALHLNYPLHELSSGKPLAYKQAFLEEWLQDRVKNKGIRYYAEATFLYDE